MHAVPEDIDQHSFGVGICSTCSISSQDPWVHRKGGKAVRSLTNGFGTRCSSSSQRAQMVAAADVC